MKQGMSLRTKRSNLKLLWIASSLYTPRYTRLFRNSVLTIAIITAFLTIDNGRGHDHRTFPSDTLTTSYGFRAFSITSGGIWAT